MKCRSREYQTHMEKFRIYQKWNHREKLQDGGVVGHVLIFSCENSKIATNRWTIIDRKMFSSVQFSHSVMSDSVIPWTTTRQASLSITYSQSLFKLMSIESVMSSYYLVLCRPLLLLPSIFPSIRVFSSEVAKVLEFLHQVAKVLEFQLQHQSFQWIFRTDFL